ncbi:MAG: hypothetical protein ACMXYM_01945 [Candidatus Woesearchaeota archaeon]
MKRDVLGILSVVLAVIAAPIGLIVSIVSLLRNKSAQRSIALPIVGIVVSIVMLPVIVVSLGTVGYLFAFEGPVESGEDSESFSSLAECLTNNGVVMYGSDGCPACRNQKLIFDDWDAIEYIECDKDRDACQRAGIRSIPTWVRADEVLVGMQSAERLAAFGGCDV